MTILSDFLSLFYPRICMACGNTLFKNEEVLCTFCLFHLPKTNFHLEKDNPVSMTFWGRVPVYSAAACYYFRKGGKVQHLLHQLKYNGQKEIGVYIGKRYGHDLKQSEFFKTVDCVLPVPLYWKKERQRGYNQSEMFASGLAEAMNIELNTNTLLRIKASETQTKKSRFGRWENVKEIFEVKNAEHLAGKHLLLVDDVITTGATLEASIHALLTIPEVKISIAAIAFARS